MNRVRLQIEQFPGSLGCDATPVVRILNDSGKIGDDRIGVLLVEGVVRVKNQSFNADGLDGRTGRWWRNEMIS